VRVVCSSYRGGDTLRYDNEMGYSTRVLDLMNHMEKHN
jgi:hypothetical protein